MSKLDEFAVMVICHGRAENTPTYATLRKYGYTGRILIVCDDQDPDLQNYIDIYGDDVKIFSKDEVVKKFDTMDIPKHRKCIVYARNACYDIAEQEGLKYFCEYDDDYISNPYRWEEDGVFYRSTRANLDAVFEAHLDFLETNENIYTVAFGQAGDYIGGVGSNLVRKHYLRKAMNSFICKTDRRIIFNGTINEDVNAYVCNGSRGQIFITFDFMMIDQAETQSQEGGMADLYLGVGTYQKSFYTVLCSPSCVKVGMMGDRHYRPHHNVDWDAAVPKIISGRYKKA